MALPYVREGLASRTYKNNTMNKQLSDKRVLRTNTPADEIQYGPIPLILSDYPPIADFSLLYKIPPHQT
jgi:hypothetical protein